MAIPTNYFDIPYFYARNYVQNTVWAAGHPAIPLNVNDIIQSDGDTEFHLRRYQLNTGNTGIVQYQLFNASQQQFTSSPQGFQVGAVSRFPPFLDTPIVPPYIYPKGAGIQHQFSVQNMLSLPLTLGFPDVDGVHTDLVNILPIVYQGVKRWYLPPNYKADYNYHKVQWSYVFTFDLDWLYLKAPFNGTFQVNEPHRFYVPILNYDFELMTIKASFNQVNSDSGSGANGYMAQIYDASGTSLMNTFIHLPDTISAIGSIDYDYPANMWPCPPIVYPKGSTIVVDILSLADINSGGTGNTSITFEGIQRIPC